MSGYDRYEYLSWSWSRRLLIFVQQSTVNSHYHPVLLILFYHISIRTCTISHYLAGLSVNFNDHELQSSLLSYHSQQIWHTKARLTLTLPISSLSSFHSSISFFRSLFFLITSLLFPSLLQYGEYLYILTHTHAHTHTHSLTHTWRHVSA